MKKIIAVILILSLMLGMLSLSYAEYQPEFVKVKLDGKLTQVKEVNVLVNGEPIKSDVPSVIYEGRTLVPVRFVANYLNADVEWFQDDREVEINTADRQIVIKIDSPKVVIDGQVKDMPYNIPPKIINSRTMVPLRFVSEALGFEVGWDQKNWAAIIKFEEEKITGIDIDDKEGLPKIVLDTTGPITHKAMYLEDPYRLVIDVPNSNLSLIDNDLNGEKLFEKEVNKYPIKEIRASQFSINPDTTRLVIELDRYVGYNIQNSQDNKKLTISFENQLEDITLEEIDGREAVVIHNTNKPEYNMMRLANPDRIVIDMLDSFLEDKNYEYDIHNDYIKGVRTSQFEPDSFYDTKDKIVRVVLDIEDLDERPNFETEILDNRLIVYVDDSKIDGIDYKMENGEALISIESDRQTKYYASYDRNRNTMEIEAPKDKINIKDGVELVDDELVKDIKVEGQGDFKRISIRFKDDISYDIKSASITDDIEIGFMKDNQQLPGEQGHRDKIIVIDPGHGGKHPGTIAPTTGYKEKELTLKVALKLEKRLKELGFKTVLTRDKDEYVGLYERTDIANDADADAFVSIHFNAMPSTSEGYKDIAGIQTLYCPAYNSDVKQGDNYPFAETMHNALLKGLGMNDKGILKKPTIVVVRESKMVAALVELGFVTNPAEEKKIVTDKYHDEAVEALANGLLEYFK
ncbi:N-acetylmuramoyl-L-alanine amidase family protein [Clostridiisalibacter paucivorans]|uniref:N-acetylmuramoyl-L-alanine amidase family protein n=1 Tax=Clostridiisalibacter paucivorans TaxID=408753 RepID=UPI00047EAF61|nr:N-acetylmuramoyl-L-alanine amidase family protein [Clostridiisalibacter paucivorans]